jgi:ubiquinone/menaquinone biosynthesis C-methylase UbiE
VVIAYGGNMSQKVKFSAIEGDKYFERNKNKLVCSDDDPIIQAIAQLELIPKNILEIGCSNGFRLNLLNKIYKSDCWGIDPSAQAIQEGKKEFKELTLEKGTADALPYENEMFDMVIFGFCLYLCDRSDLFKIAYESDRVLNNLGNIVVLDFYTTFPYRNHYAHHSGLYSYKMNYSHMYLWNPAYILKYQKIFFHPPIKEGTADDMVSVMILEKNTEWAFPDNPYKRS